MFRPYSTDPNCQKGLLAFIHIEKTAGETVKWILRSSNGLNHCDVSAANIFKPLLPRELEKIQKIYPSLASIAGHPVTPYTDLDNVAQGAIRYFTFLRDPAKQLASYFQYLSFTLKMIPLDSFAEWCKTEWPQNMQTKRICGEADAAKAIKVISEKNIFIGLTELFDESLHYLKHLVAPELELGYLERNKAPNNVIAKKILEDPKNKQIIADTIHEDIILYEWAMKELVPQYRILYQDLAKQDLQFPLPYNGMGFREQAIWANRIYRNLVYRPCELLFIRKLPPIINRSIISS